MKPRTKRAVLWALEAVLILGAAVVSFFWTYPTAQIW